jgi:ATP-dependent DNA helicase RecG
MTTVKHQGNEGGAPEEVILSPCHPVIRSPAAGLQQSVQFLKGVGPARAALLRRLGIETISDLLFHFPRFYEDLSDIRPIAQLAAGKLQTVHGEVVEIEGKQLANGRSIVSVVLSDGKHCLEGIWFNKPYAARSFRYGQHLAYSGKPKWYRDHWQVTNPRVQILDAATPSEETAILPVYPLTENLRPERLREMIRLAVESYCSQVPEILPAELRKRRGLLNAPSAMYQVHLPQSLADGTAGRRRFIYEEFLVLQLALALRRRDLRDRQQAPPLQATPMINARIRRLFPFRLTADQDRAVAEICRDLVSARPMQRLVQADVGAGKTAVAAYALLVTIANKHQAALMAPTEVLARQHWHTFERYLAQSRVRRLLLTGALTPKERRAALEAIRQGEIDLVVGTQALVQEDVQFARLGLVVIDEQHRFGVSQRARVRRLGVDPHYLVMTATPIPRTMALTVFGDLDVSTIRQLPPGRQPVTTRWVTEGRREWLHERLREGIRQGRQAYYVCPMVAASETRDLKAAKETRAELQAGAFRDFRVALLHGQIDEADKDRIMEQFRCRESDVLVSTTVIEVGVDVPNATLMVIEHAERFGLSQLHQLRGRISRGTTPGECYFFAEPANDEAKERLRLFTRITDGFSLAEQDARLRGLGEFFGTRQHGLGELRLGDVIGDFELLKLARQDAHALVVADGGLRRPEHASLRRAVLERYGQTLDLAGIG